MSSRSRIAIVVSLLIGALACTLMSTPVPPTPAVQSSPSARASDTPAPTATAAASATAIPTQVALPSDTPLPDSGSGSLPFANLSDISRFFNPVGQPVQNWNGIPILPEATAGQEFMPRQVYSFTAPVTISHAVDFYQSRLPALGYTSMMAGPSTGSAGTGAKAIHDSVLYLTKDSQLLLLYIASYDSDPGHVAVVISMQ